MYSWIFLIHKYSVLLFLGFYLVKLGVFLFAARPTVEAFRRRTIVAESVVSFVFLFTGAYMLFQTPRAGAILYAKIALVILSIPLAVIGFKKNRKILAVAGVMCVVLAYGFAEMNKASFVKKLHYVYEGLKASSTAVESRRPGELFYIAHCAPCHGADGAAEIAGAINLKTSKIDDGLIEERITRGYRAMPAFRFAQGGELADVKAYIKNLRQ